MIDDQKDMKIDNVVEITGAQVGDEVKVEVSGDELRYFKNGELIKVERVPGRPLVR